MRVLSLLLVYLGKDLMDLTFQPEGDFFAFTKSSFSENLKAESCCVLLDVI